MNIDIIAIHAEKMPVSCAGNVTLLIIIHWKKP